MWEVELSWRAAIALRGVGRVARTVIRQTRRFRLADALQALGAKAQQLSLFSDGDAPAPSALEPDVETAVRAIVERAEATAGL